MIQKWKTYLFEYVYLPHFHFMYIIYIITKLSHYRYHTKNDKLVFFVFSTLLTQAARRTFAGVKTTLHIKYTVMLLIDLLKFIYLSTHVLMHHTQYFIPLHVVHSFPLKVGKNIHIMGTSRQKSSLIQKTVTEYIGLLSECIHSLIHLSLLSL
jgi:hypothetical protein